MTVDFAALQTELTTDPEILGYVVAPSPPDNEADAYTDADLLNSLATGRDRIKAQVSGADAFSVTDPTEFDALTGAERTEWLALCAIDSVNPANGTPAEAMATRIFGGGSVTLVNLNAFRTETISRAVELFGTNVVPGDVQAARIL